MANRFPNGIQRDEYETMTILDAVNLMIEQSGRPEKAIAVDIRKPLSTLQRELRPQDDGAKVGIEDLFPIIVACCGANPEEAPAPLVWLCRRLGFEVRPFGEAEPDAETVERECLQSSQAMAKAHRLILDGVHPDRVHAAIAEAKRELDQDATKYRREWNR